MKPAYWPPGGNQGEFASCKNALLGLFPEVPKSNVHNSQNNKAPRNYMGLWFVMVKMHLKMNQFIHTLEYCMVVNNAHTHVSARINL